MTKLTMMDYLKNRPTMNNSAWWGCKGVSRNSADIVLVTPTNNIIELQRSIDVGETRKFKSGPSVKVTGVQIGYPDAYANVNISGKVAPVETEQHITTVLGEVCTEAYNTDLVVKIPNKDGGFESYTYNVYIPAVCVGEEPGMVTEPDIACSEGEVSGEVSCWDGSRINTLECKSGVWVPTGKTCLPSPKAKTVKILSKGYNLPNAYVGKTIQITASVLCGLDKSVGEYALLTVDGVPIDEGRTGGGADGPGFVSFNWRVEGESGPRKLCVRVSKSDECPGYSEATDCRIMMVSSVKPSIEEQLAQEREELKDRLETIRQERKYQMGQQEETVDSTLPDTISDKLPEITIVEPDIDVDPTKDVAEVIEEMGTIKIPSILIPDKIKILPTISIDNNIVGHPPVQVNVAPGKHQIKAEVRGLTSMYKSVIVEPGMVHTITDLSFI